jgi:hypothetical protein
LLAAMRRLLHLGIAICLVGWLAWRYGGMIPLFGPVTPAMPNPEDGKVANGVYSNDYFGLSYLLPEGWAEGLAGPEPSHSGYYALRTLIPHDELDATILIAAQDMFFADKPLSNAVEAASDFRRAMSEIEGMTIDREPFELRIADHTMERVDFSGVGLYRAMFVTEARCHLVSFNLTTRDPERLANLTLSVNSLSFAHRKGTLSSAPACVKNYAVAENLLRKVEPAIIDSTLVPIPARITIGVDGNVKHIHVIRATADQRKSIEHALAQWQFRPYEAQGRAVEIETGMVFQSKQMGM